MPRSNESLTPRERAKKFSTGIFTANQTGARPEAARKARNTMVRNIASQSGNTIDFERMIRRGGK